MAIKDISKARLTLAVADTKPVRSIRVSVNIDHTYIGDLIVRLKPPAAMGVSPAVLHDREGGATRNLRTTYDEVNAPGLAACHGKSSSCIRTHPGRRSKTRERRQR